MHVRARHLCCTGFIAVLVLTCCSNKKSPGNKKVDLKFSVVKTKLDPPLGHAQKLCVTVKGDPRCEFGMYTIPEGGEEPTRFRIAGKPAGTFRTKMPGGGMATVCFDISEQPAGALEHRLGAVVKAGDGKTSGSKDVKVKYTRPPFIKFQGVSIWFTGFADQTWSMGYHRAGVMNMTIPPRTRVTVDGTTTVTDKHEVIIPLPMARKARDLALTDILGGSDKGVKIPISIQLPNGQVHKGALELTVGKHFKEWLETRMARVVQEWGVTFKGGPRAPAARSVYYRGKVFGPARNVFDITHVAVRVEKVRKRSCDDSLEASTEDWFIRVYHRERPKPIKHRIFRGKMPPCPEKTRGSAGSTHSRPDEGQVKKWLEGLAG